MKRPVSAHQLFPITGDIGDAVWQALNFITAAMGMVVSGGGKPGGSPGKHMLSPAEFFRAGKGGAYECEKSLLRYCKELQKDPDWHWRCG